MIAAIGRLAIFVGGTLSHLVRPPFYWREFLSQLLFIGYFSLPVVGLTTLFTGGALALQIYAGGARFNAEAVVPQIVALGMVRELGPVLGGLMVAGRVSAAIAAEIEIAPRMTRSAPLVARRPADEDFMIEAPEPDDFDEPDMLYADPAPEPEPKGGLRLRLPGLMKRAETEPEPELVEPQPLAVQFGGDRLEFSWPAKGDFILESTDALGQAAEWGEVGSGTAKEGDRYVVRVRPSASQQFFRLRSE